MAVALMVKIHTEAIKGRLFNLIIYTNEPRRTEYFHEMVHLLIEKFPCRVIFIEWDQESDRGYIETGCMDEVGQCDQIRIKSTKEHLEQVPFLVIPNLVPDLPVYLVWGQDVTAEDTILPDLQKFATRLVYDSECTPDLQSFSSSILRLIDTLNIEFMDLNWALLKGWRDVIAETFETEENFNLLERCTSISIAYNEVQSIFVKQCSTRALYLQGWLAAQLEWKVVRNDKLTIHYQKGSREIVVTLVPMEKRDFPPGSILEVNFSTDLGEEIKISRPDPEPKAIVHITTQNKCELPYTFHLPNMQKSLSFMKEIFYYRTSEQYRKMLRILKGVNHS